MRPHTPRNRVGRLLVGLVLAVAMLLAVPGSLTQPLAGGFGSDANPAAGLVEDSVGLAFPFATGQDVYSAGIHANNGADGAKNAIDFAPRDGMVRAPAAGVARYLYCGEGYWLTVEHADGWRTGYYHLQDIRPADGERVAAGTPLGRIGNATPCGGSSTGAHVHFSLWRRVDTGDGGSRFAAVDLSGHRIGGWVARSADGQYGGRLVNPLTYQAVRLPGVFQP